MTGGAFWKFGTTEVGFLYLHLVLTSINAFPEVCLQFRNGFYLQAHRHSLSQLPTLLYLPFGQLGHDAGHCRG